MSFNDKILAGVGNNTKLGGSVSYTVGQDRKQAKESCKVTGCDFLHVDDGGNAGRFRITSGPSKGQIVEKSDTFVEAEACEKHGAIRKTVIGNFLCEKIPLCYAHNGTDSFSLASKAKAHKAGKDYTLETAINAAPRKVSTVRGATIGDPAGLLTEQELQEIDDRIRAEDMSHILYSHGWKVKPWILRFACASANSWEEINEAFRAGASVVTVTNPELVAKGSFHVWGLEKIPIINCLEASHGKTCNECKLCDAPARRLNQRTPRIIVVFPDHGPGSHKRARAVRRRSTLKALGISERRYDALKGSGKLLAELKVAKAKAKADKVSAQIDRLIKWYRS